MSKSYLCPAPLHDYALANSLREPEILQRLREETSSHPRAQMQIPPEQGQFFQLLTQLIGARKALEIGVFTGYSSLSVALAMPDEGRLVACDVSEEFTTVARRYWREAGVEHKITLHIAPAAETLQALLDAGEAGTFDFAFIDADKPAYDTYYEYALQLVRRGGLIALDNMLQHGKVVDPDNREEGAVALRALARKIHRDERVVQTMLTISDGITLAIKR